MSQLRDDYSKFRKRGSIIIIIGPESAVAFKSYWDKNGLPFFGLPDPRHSVLKLYGQQIKILKFGRMPAQVIVDKQGIVRYIHYGKSMSDIPENDQLLKIIDKLTLE